MRWRPLPIVAFGTLIRNRRLASAVCTLGPDHAYEARILVRSILELLINYEWMRLRNSHSRASRFLRYQALDRVKLLEGLPPGIRPPNYDDICRTWRRKMTARRHLFRITTKDGKRVWTKSWATAASFEARLTEVTRAKAKQAGNPPYDLYVYYRWFSGTVHGNADSIQVCLEPHNGRVREKAEPDPKPFAPLTAACGALNFTTGNVVVDLDLPESFADRVLEQRTSIEQIAKVSLSL
jgi:hypothetical protein